MQWQIDSAHTTVTAAVKHMMISTVRGSFAGTSGTINFDPKAPEQGSITLQIPAASVNTGDLKRDGHLRSADFLDAEKHPAITFNSTKITSQGKDQFVVDGVLTIRGITKPVSGEVLLAGIGADPQKGQRAAFDATFSFDRTQWGLTWNMPVPSGVLVSEKIKIEANIAATPVAVAVAA